MAGETPRGVRARFWAPPAAALLVMASWLATEEGTRNGAYWDSVGEVWTICRGLTGPDIVQGLVLTDAQCREREAAYVQAQAQRMGKCLRVPLSMEEWVAWGDFSYNVGTTAFCRSTALRLLNADQRAAACAQITRYKFAGGLDCSKDRRCRGVWRRRLRERTYCEMGV